MKTNKALLITILFSFSIIINLNAQRPNCEIGEISVTQTECDEGYFNVYLDFDYANTSNAFKVVGNGNEYGVFEYEDLPVLIGPLPGDGVTTYEFVVIDLEFGDCSNWAAIDPVNCEGGGGECFIGEVFADPTECEEGMFYVYLNFEYENTGETFKVQGNGNMYGVFEYEDLPILIGPLEGDGITVYEFVVKDLAHEGCNNWTAIDPIDCEGGGGGDCFIGDPFAVIQFPCENGGFNVQLNFEYENVSNEGFKVFGNGQNYGTFTYEDLPVIVGPFEGNGYSTYELGVRDLVYEDCQNWTFVCAVNCGGGNECFIGDLMIDDNPCDGDYFDVYLNFNYENVGEQGFKVIGNGENYGTFEYGDLPVVVGPFLGDGSTIYELGVVDLEFEYCSNWADFGPISCGETGMDGSEIPVLKLFPNPAEDAVYVSFHQKPEEEIYIILKDITGKNIINKIVTTRKIEKIDLSNLKTGLYLIEIRIDNYSLYEKLVVK